MKSISELINQLAGHGVSINIEGNSFRLVRPPSLPSWEGAPEELKTLVRELKANKQEVTCFLLWQTMLDRCNRDYKPGALAWCRQHFPDLERQLIEAESRFEKAYWQQDIEGCRQAAADWEATLRRICHQLAEGGEVLDEAEKPF